MNTYLKEGQYFFSDIRKEGVVLYELDDEELPEPKLLTAQDRLRIARLHLEARFSIANTFLKGSRFYLAEGHVSVAAFELH